MKSIGIIRRIDNLGRIVIPKEMRETLELTNDDPVEIIAEADRIIVKKYTSACIFCQSNDNITEYKGKNICRECLDELGKF